MPEGIAAAVGAAELPVTLATVVFAPTDANAESASAAYAGFADDPCDTKGKPLVELGAIPASAAEVPPLTTTSYCAIFANVPRFVAVAAVGAADVESNWKPEIAAPCTVAVVPEVG